MSMLFTVCIIFSSGIEISPVTVLNMMPRNIALVPGVNNYLALMVRPSCSNAGYKESKATCVPCGVLTPKKSST